MSGASPKKVGLLCGREQAFPEAFLSAVNRRGKGVSAEMVKLGGTRMDEPCPYAVLVDRISHEVPYYRSYLKHAVLQGATVVNDPFRWSADDKFHGASLAARLGLAHPRTLVLPNHSYSPVLSPTESLRNLVYPLDWRAIVEYVGLPCVLKDAHGGGWRDVYLCESLEDLVRRYDQTGRKTMIVQEFVDFEVYVRCLCLGRRDVLCMQYDPRHRKYLPEPGFPGKELEARLVADSRALVRALGYDMNTVEWAVKGGVPYAIDFLNPAPDFDPHSLTPAYFEWAVERMARMVIRLARSQRALDLPEPRPRPGV